MSIGWIEALCIVTIGSVEYVVESRHDGRFETWYVVRPHRRASPRGIAITRGDRLIVEARSLRAVGVLESEVPPAPPSAGYNPYFDLPPA